MLLSSHEESLLRQQPGARHADSNPQEPIKGWVDANISWGSGGGVWVGGGG